ncbi:hypothetical protein QAD02_002995 [Eretmocerus hayati]|uniref:Uncharacterized protein n=1 Tax=Eretmocerus hayati TaxID=131215 RepID=A0ACC2NKV4_9HYME|nr:hypothetical protein QAD02_002995 [Eretmocerus hayati]
MNARTGDKGEDASKDEERNSRDGTVNREGLGLLEEIENHALMIVNGDIDRDRGGEYTYIGARGNTVINYVITNKEGKENMERMRIENMIKSDHLLIEVETDLIKEEQAGRLRTTQKWDEKAIKKYEKITEGWGKVRNWSEM